MKFFLVSIIAISNVLLPNPLDVVDGGLEIEKPPLEIIRKHRLEEFSYEEYKQLIDFGLMSFVITAEVESQKVAKVDFMGEYDELTTILNKEIDPELVHKLESLMLRELVILKLTPSTDSSKTESVTYMVKLNKKDKRILRKFKKKH